MTETMRVDIAALRGCEPVFSILSQVLDETRRRLGDRLDAEGACWGGDEAGMAFQESYGPAAATVREALSGLWLGVTSVGESLVEAADNAEAAEHRTAVRLG
jgi:uncharacterized protein YukE